jgi:formate dehydrogenase maturation protein FdhE
MMVIGIVVVIIINTGKLTKVCNEKIDDNDDKESEKDNKEKDENEILIVRRSDDYKKMLSEGKEYYERMHTCPECGSRETKDLLMIDSAYNKVCKCKICGCIWKFKYTDAYKT